MCQVRSFALHACTLNRMVKAVARSARVTRARCALFGANTPRNRVKLTRSFGTSATSRAMTCTDALMPREAGCREWLPFVDRRANARTGFPASQATATYSHPCEVVLSLSLTGPFAIVAARAVFGSQASRHGVLGGGAQVTSAYEAAFERVVCPALRTYKPQLIVVPSGFDAGGQDPLGRMMVSTLYSERTGRTPVKGKRPGKCGLKA
jgi:hypothetical protein